MGENAAQDQGMRMAPLSVRHILHPGITHARLGVGVVIELAHKRLFEGFLRLICEIGANGGQVEINIVFARGVADARHIIEAAC